MRRQARYRTVPMTLQPWPMIGATLLTLGLLFAAASPAHANPRYADLVIDAITGEVFHEENADRRLHPASLTKMMTLYLTFKALEEGALTLHQPLAVSAHAVEQAPSKIGLPEGATIRVEEAIYALVTRSANDIAVVLAEAIGGSESAFARRMTQEARRLGMTQTTFQNASGLPDDEQWTSARDMARLAQALIREFPRYYRYFGTESWSYRGITYRNHNRLMSSYDGMDGLKTGYIRASGFNLVASAVRGNLRLIGVVFGGESAESRNQRMVTLLDDAFESRRGEQLVARGGGRPERSPFEVPVPGRRPDAAVAVVAAPNTGNGGQDEAEADEDSTDEPPQVAAVGRGLGSMTVPTSATLPSLVPTAPMPEALRDFPTPPSPPLSQRPDLVPATYQPRRTSLEPLAGQSLAATIAAPAVEEGDSDTGGDGAALPGSGWGIQVGAFRTAEDGRRALEAAARRVPDLVSPASRQVTEVATEGGRLYRARLVGLDARAAALVCARLNDRGIGCLTIAPGGAN